MARVVAVAQVHVEDTREGVAVFGGEGARIEVRIAEDLAAQRREPAAEARHLGEVVRIGDLHPLHAPLQEFRGIAPHHDAVVADRRGDSGKGRDQTRRVVHTSGIARRLLDAQHAAAGKGHRIQRLGLVDRGPYNDLLDGNQRLRQANVEHHLLRRTDEDLAQPCRLIAQTTHRDVVPSHGHPPQHKSSQRIGRRTDRRLHVCDHDRGIRDGVAAVPIRDGAPDGLRDGLGGQGRADRQKYGEQEGGVLHGGFVCGFIPQN